MITGSAAFFADLDQANRQDQRSSHGGCPVLAGSKWIINKWIYSYEQWKKYPCGLEFDTNLKLVDTDKDFVPQDSRGPIMPKRLPLNYVYDPYY